MLICTPAIKAIIREAKTHQIYSLMQAGQKFGMQTMNQALLQAVLDKALSPEDALDRSTDRLGSMACSARSCGPPRRGGRHGSLCVEGAHLAGEPQAGRSRSAVAEEALDVLRKKKILITSMKPKTGGGFTLPKIGGSGVSTKDLAIFTRQFATMISAGLPLVQCLDILAKQSSKPSFGRVISEVTREVESGSTLSDALGKHRPVFDDLFRNTVAAGEGRR